MVFKINLKLYCYNFLDCNSIFLIDVIILFDILEDLSLLKGSFFYFLKFVDKFVDFFDMVYIDIKVVMFMFSSDL